ncbi:hypothetical protein ASL14_12845 [Paenibacillus sp. IHB B 3084]|uniref:DUF4153 domain-containing protein n=1 Tax=Paenibacillus sp. IHB B 3084 TaxID=867076 RepID=UPI0007222C03|nr:DUF4173 domain-containing protein [Paenibacillus sp. IHB B 3084]ALP36922.1 hypothetical protein ASL14_12845 [Paenibacillus sp. IHB B 3084]
MHDKLSGTSLPKPSFLSAFAAAIVLALVHQYLFYGHALGVSLPIFVILFYTYMYVYNRDRIQLDSWMGRLLFAVVVLLSLTYVLFDNPVLYVLNALALPALISVHMVMLLGEKRHSWSEPGIIGQALSHLFYQNLRHIVTPFRMFKTAALRNVKDERKRVLGKVIVGLLIALPLLFIIISLLASADGMFEKLLSGIPSWIGTLSFGSGMLRLIWTCFFTFCFFCYLWGFVQPAPRNMEREVQSWHGLDERTNGQTAEYDGHSSVMINKSAVPYHEPVAIKFDPVITATVLIVMNLVYVVFVVLQFGYLFGAWEGALPEGTSYAEYARRGFGELVMVTGINFVLMISVLKWTEFGSNLLLKMNNGLLYVLVGCSGVMLYSGYTRLVMYEEAYGYTYTRYLVHAFMIFLGLLLLIAAVRIHVRQLPLAKYYIVLALVAYVVVNYVGIDVRIAENNLERYRTTSVIDKEYLSGLSADAIPLLIEFSRKEHGAMDEFLQARLTSMTREETAWPAFNWAEYRAQRKLHDYILE